jgi:RHS repeat-associated protein
MTWRVFAIDVTVDGKRDLLFSDIIFKWHVRKRAGNHADLVTRVTNGLGHYEAPAYQPMATAVWSGYTVSAPVTGPAVRVVFGAPEFVVSQVTSTDGVASASTWTSTYSYQNARKDTTGRGLLGFEKAQAIDSRNGSRIETTYAQNWPLSGLIELWQWRRPISDRLLIEYDPTWLPHTFSAFGDPAGDYHFIRLDSDVRREYDLDVTPTLMRTTGRLLSYNFNHGAATAEEVSISATGQPTYHHNTYTTLDDGLRTGAYCLGVPTRVDVTKDIGGANSLTRTVQWFNLPTTCRKLYETVGPVSDTSRQLIRQFSYDNTTGQVTQITQNPGDLSSPERAVQFTYGSGVLRARPLSETHLISGESPHATGYAWNNGLGVVTARTNVQGLSTTWLYDTFGRQTRETRPDGTFTNTGWSDCDTTCLGNANPRYRITDTGSDGYGLTSYFDPLERSIATDQALSDGQTGRVRRSYDSLGRLDRESLPYMLVSGTPVYYLDRDYDILNRLINEERPADQADTTPDDGTGSVWATTYTGLNRTVTDPRGFATTYESNADSTLRRVAGPAGSTADYTWTAFGELKTMTDAGGNMTTLSYDTRGWLIGSTDPDRGSRAFNYNGFGQLISERDAKTPANTVTYTHDQLGRLVTRFDPGEGTTTWTYVTAAGTSKGLLQQVVGPIDGNATGWQEAHTYDNLSRLTQSLVTLEGTPYQTNRSYDGQSRPETIIHPVTIAGARPTFVYSYTGTGYLNQVQQDTGVGLIPLYQQADTEAAGRESRAIFGNASFDAQTIYDLGHGRVKIIQAGPSLGTSLQHHSYTWDKSGNLTQRINQNLTVTEDLNYDGVNRLTQTKRNGVVTSILTYDAQGNVVTKSDVGTYSYGQAGTVPHGVTSITGTRPNSYRYDANGQMECRGSAATPCPAAADAITWTSFGYTKRVEQAADSATFTYGPDRQRVKTVLVKGGVTTTIHTIGPHFEKEVGSETLYRSHVFANGRAIYIQTNSSIPANGVQGYYALRDHQGSVDRLIRDVGVGPSGYTYAFDAWGKRRNTDVTADPTDALLGQTHWTRRGYTGHEHVDVAKLIHMNGRIQDPITGRMLSADPVSYGGVTDPQSLNPFSYVQNNPARYTDLSGFYKAGTIPEILVLGYSSLLPARLFAGSGGFGGLGAVLLGLDGLGSRTLVSASATTGRGDRQADDEESELGSGGKQEKTSPWRGDTTSALAGSPFALPPIPPGQDFRTTTEEITVYGEVMTEGLLITAAFAEPTPLGEILVVARAARGTPQVLRDVVLRGGRGGENVKDLVGPPNSVVRGGGERAFVTNDKGQVVLDITRGRVKPVKPGEGFGPKRPPTPDELRLLDRVLGGGP